MCHCAQVSQTVQLCEWHFCHGSRCTHLLQHAIHVAQSNAMKERIEARTLLEVRNLLAFKSVAGPTCKWSAGLDSHAEKLLWIFT